MARKYSYKRDEKVPWTCPFCGKEMMVTRSAINAGKKSCRTDCPGKVGPKRRIGPDQLRRVNRDKN